MSESFDAADVTWDVVDLDRCTHMKIYDATTGELVARHKLVDGEWVEATEDDCLSWPADIPEVDGSGWTAGGSGEG